MVDLISKNWRELIKPKRIEIDAESYTHSYGRFVCEPLERGFGITVGNSLRRVLLSSLQGAAIVSVKFDEVLHEFSTIPGVLEDVTDIILNLKAIRLKMVDAEEAVIRLNREGEGAVTAGDIETGGLVEILNPDQSIATLNKEGKVSMEMVVRTGKGYVPAEKNKTPDMPIGVIPIDAVFSSIQKVNYVVTNARVGQMTDYDKLTLEVWTDGSVLPEDAVAYAAKILKEQMNPFINFEEESEPVEEEEDVEREKLNENLFRPVSDLELSVRSANCLQNAKISLIGELVQKTDAEMLKTKNFGRKSLNEIKAILEDMGLSLGMKIPHFPSAPIPEDEKEDKHAGADTEGDEDMEEEGSADEAGDGDKGEKVKKKKKKKEKTPPEKEGEKKGKGKDK
ncbi:MAG: DNA-directed polymerase subunit alpha [Thermodesulfobacteriota bacterium]|nr:DNA-directed polymerase subunit alpha [Thermodesulfobacteriota bacterium]